jgi:hypothetical protein
MAATNFNFFDVGGCNCVSVCGGSPCPLPSTNLTVTRLASTVPPNTHSATLVYSIAGGCCIWQGCVSSGGTDLDLFTILSNRACTLFTFAAAISGSCGSPGQNSTYFSPAACTHCGSIPGSGSLGPMTLVSFNCAPLNIVLTIGVLTWTITL